MSRFDLRLAWWLARGQLGRLSLLVACIAVGVAARVCVGSFIGQLDRALAREARPLLGADFEVVSNQPLSAEQQRALAARLPADARTITQLGFVTIASCVRSGGSHLVELRAVSPGYPLYGGVRIEAQGGASVDVARLFSDTAVAFVQRDLLAQVHADIGDELRLGRGTFVIAGVILEEPGVGANPFTLGPRVLIAQARVADTALDTVGSRVRHATLVACAEPQAADRVVADLRAAWQLPTDAPTGFGGRAESASGIVVRSARQSQETLSRFFERLGDFLRLVSLTALLLGGVGVASMVRGFVAERLDMVATINVLGASTTRVMRVFVLQAMAVGLVGGVVGAVMGALIQNALSFVVRGSLPIVLGYGLDVPAMAWGVALGVITAGFSAALPLIEVCALKPLAVMRGDRSGLAARWPGWIVLALGAGVFSVIAAVESRSWILGPMYIGGLAAGALTLQLLSLIALPALARSPLRRLGFGPKHGLGNLRRAGFRPAAAVVAIGSSALLFGSMMLHQASLQRELDPGRHGGLPSLFAMDLQSDQLDDFRAALVREGCLGEPALSPVVHGRYRGMRSHDGSAPAARTGGGSRWLRDREQNLSWRERLGPDETIIAGAWMGDAGDAVEASLERRFASRMGAKVGDVLEFDVQGVSLAATVTSIRAVTWGGLKPNFLILLSPHALRDAPQTWVAAIPSLPGDGKSRVQGALALAFPNVTVFDISSIGTRIRDIVDRISLAVRFMGLFCLLAGLVVLVGVGLSTARERLLDAALLKVLGGGNRTLAASLACEFAALGLVGAGLGMALALGFGWIVVERVMDLTLAIPWVQLVALVVGMAAISAIAGVVACRRVFTARPLEVLREG